MLLDFRNVGITFLLTDIVPFVLIGSFGLLLWTRGDISDHAECFRETRVWVMGQAVPATNPNLRKASIAFYSLFVVALLPNGITQIAWIVTWTLNTLAKLCFARRFGSTWWWKLSGTTPFKMFRAAVGIIPVLYMIAAVEGTIRINSSIVDTADTDKWGFGQVVALLLVPVLIVGVVWEWAVTWRYLRFWRIQWRTAIEKEIPPPNTIPPDATDSRKSLLASMRQVQFFPTGRNVASIYDFMGGKAGTGSFGTFRDQLEIYRNNRDKSVSFRL